ncbi:MAG: glycosyltransferase [Spirochaetes bacterium]|nr:glycosyltransferase [Spirochaetota bacterium]
MVVTDTFPPINKVGVHRTVGLCRGLTEKGWHVTVITARPTAHSPVDPGLLADVPPTVRIVRTAAPDVLLLAASMTRRQARTTVPKDWAAAGVPLRSPMAGGCSLRTAKDWLSRWLRLPDGRVGWFLPAVWAGLREDARRRPDVLFSSAPSWTSHLVAGALSHLLRVPWVADFRDPWSGSAFRRFPYAAHRRVDEWLEDQVVRQATRVTCAWDGIRQHLTRRYPRRAGHIHTILNGFDPEQIDSVEAVYLDRCHCVLVHTGSFYGPRNPIAFFKGLRYLQDKWPDAASHLRVFLIGDPTYNGQPLQRLLEESGVGDLASLVSPLPHREALAVLKGADVALLFGQSGIASLASVPAKVYEYVGARRPVLAIGAGQEASDIMRHGGCRVWTVADGNPGEIATVLQTIAADHQRGNLGARVDETARLRFSRERMAEGLESMLRASIEAWSGRRRDRSGKASPGDRLA